MVSSKFLSSSWLFLLVVVTSSRSGDGSIKDYKEIELPGVIGGESFGFDCEGKGPYVGVSDGRILKWEASTRTWIEFATTSPIRQRSVCDGSTDPEKEPICGRPLGLKFHVETCELYVADAYYGLLVVGSEGGQATQLVASAEGVPLRFTNALDIDPHASAVYFTDSSTYFQRRDYAFGYLTADKTGRLLRYNLKTKQVTVLVRDMAMPNGISLSQNNSFLLVAESFTMKILKFPIQDSDQSILHAPETFAQLGRFPDNIKRNGNGEFWVGLNSARGRIQRVEKEEKIEWFVQDPVGVKFSEEGVVLKVIDGNFGKSLDSVSEIEEFEGRLWIGSSVQPYIGYMKN